MENLVFRATPPSRKTHVPSIITEVPKESTIRNLQLHMFIASDELGAKHTEYMSTDGGGHLTTVSNAVSKARGSCDCIKLGDPSKSFSKL